MVALDLSKSMEETDLPPDRLGAAQGAVRRFIAARRHERIGNERDPVIGLHDGTLEYKIPKRPIRKTTPAALSAGDFAAGSMGPKVRAACSFVERTGGFAAIGSIADTPALLRGEAGTIVTPST